MSSLTPRLGLKRPDTSDGFSHQDFVDNYNKIDGAPGRFICTSTSRPTWGTAHKGMSIKEIDTGRILDWNGSTWVEPPVAVAQWGFSANPGQYVNASTTVNYTLGTITLSRPALVCGILTAHLACRNNAYQGVRTQAAVDGVNVTLGAGDDAALTLWSPGSSAYYDHRVATALWQADLAAGTHTIQGRIFVGGYSTSNAFIGNLAAIAFIASGNGGTLTSL